MSKRIAVIAGVVLLALAAPVGAQQSPDPLSGLSWLIGKWRVPPGDSALLRTPQLAGVIVFQLDRIVGGNAIRVREGVPVAHPDSADLDGTAYWDPAEERIEFVAVAGRASGQGRLFVGTFVPRADGRIERHYDVFYRTLADTPGESAGGSRRSYREVWEQLGADRVQHTLEWWWEGKWQPYARGRYTLVRAR